MATLGMMAFLRCSRMGRSGASSLCTTFRCRSVAVGAMTGMGWEVAAADSFLWLAMLPDGSVRCQLTLNNFSIGKRVGAGWAGSSPTQNGRKILSVVGDRLAMWGDDGILAMEPDGWVRCQPTLHNFSI